MPGRVLPASQHEFRMAVTGVGVFMPQTAAGLNTAAASGADHGWVKLYLNGQVLVALLHQRKIISFHASSFMYMGRGSWCSGRPVPANRRLRSPSPLEMRVSSLTI